MAYERGPLRTYELTWANGHVEKLRGHQCTLPYAGSFGSRANERINIHGEFDGHWGLVLSVDARLIACVRDVTEFEEVPSG